MKTMGKEIYPENDILMSLLNLYRNVFEFCMGYLEGAEDFSQEIFQQKLNLLDKDMDVFIALSLLPENKEFLKDNEERVAETIYRAECLRGTIQRND